VSLSFVLEQAVATMLGEALKALRRRLGAHLTDGECVHVMLLLVARAHVWEVKHPDTLATSVYQRDGWTCQMPTCRSLGPLHAHHVWWRSAGGPDEAYNLLTLCERCHVLVHERKVVILPGRSPKEHVFMMGLLPDGSCREAWRNGERVDPTGLDWKRAWSRVQRMRAA
jgi:hypothetical protein